MRLAVPMSFQFFQNSFKRPQTGSAFCSSERAWSAFTASNHSEVGLSSKPTGFLATGLVETVGGTKRSGELKKVSLTTSDLPQPLWPSFELRCQFLFFGWLDCCDWDLRYVWTIKDVLQDRLTFSSNSVTVSEGNSYNWPRKWAWRIACCTSRDGVART